MRVKEVKLEQAAYDFNGKMSLRQAIPLGLQHVCAGMFVGDLTPLLVPITGACGMVGGEFAHLQIDLLQNAMFVAGIVTLVQLFAIGAIGGKVPHHDGHQLWFYWGVQQCGGYHGRRRAELWCHYGCIHSGRFV